MVEIMIHMDWDVEHRKFKSVVPEEVKNQFGDIEEICSGSKISFTCPTELSNKLEMLFTNQEYQEYFTNFIISLLFTICTSLCVAMASGDVKAVENAVFAMAKEVTFHVMKD